LAEIKTVLYCDEGRKWPQPRLIITDPPNSGYLSVVFCHEYGSECDDYHGDYWSNRFCDEGKKALRDLRLESEWELDDHDSNTFVSQRKKRQRVDFCLLADRAAMGKALRWAHVVEEVALLRIPVSRIHESESEEDEEEEED